MPEAIAQPAGQMPSPAEWPKFFKWWLIWQHARVRFLPWKKPDDVWLDLLRDSMNGVREGAARPNPRGLSISVSAEDVYPRALAEATGWRERGSPLA